MPEYEIYAMQYAGPFGRKEAMVMWLTDWEASLKVHYYLWAVKGPQETILVDAGAPPEIMAERELINYQSPLDLLAGMGLAPDDIKRVILTHLHWDHMSGITLFPKAAFYVQKKEYDFWVKNPYAQRAAFCGIGHRPSLDKLAALHKEGRVVLLEGDVELVPGLECLLAPGHTPGLQALAVNTAQGTAVLGSDTGHVFRNLEEGWPSCIIHDIEAWMGSFDKLKAVASRPELLFPGHDVRMQSEYPEAYPRVFRLV